MPRSNHSPVRTCLGCRERDAKSAMVRIASRRGSIMLDPEASAGGRGGYLHPRARCLEGFVKARFKECRSLKSPLGREQRLELAKIVELRLAPSAGLE